MFQVAVPQSPEVDGEPTKHFESMGAQLWPTDANFKAFEILARIYCATELGRYCAVCTRAVKELCSPVNLTAIWVIPRPPAGP